jgi:TPR repeat protein
MKPARSNFFRAYGPTALGERYERLCELEGSSQPRPERATLERVWVLADRLHHLFEVRKELGKAREFGAALRQPENRDDLMLVKLEVWLNAILRLVKPTLIEELYERGKRFNLVTSYLHLEVLPKVELDLAYGDRNQITCPIRRAMLAAKEVRNPETHDSSSTAMSALSEAYAGVAAVVVTTLLRHEDWLRAATRALLLQPLDLPAALQQCASIRNEHRFHLKTFAGRRAWLDRLDELAREAKAKASPRTIVIHGAQGQGKSGLMAQWADRTATSSGHDWHPNTGEVVRDAAPWLSGCLYISAKIAKQPQAVAQSLLFQMSALVLEPVNEPHASREGRGSLRRPSLAPGATGAAPTRADRSLVSLDFSALDHFDLDIQLQEHPAQVTTEQYQWAITDGLRRLVAERGPVTVVFDAADEVLEVQASGLDVLPAQWPDGVTAIFTVRDGPHRGGLLARLVGAETWALGPLTLEDVAEVLGLEGRDSAEAQRLHAQSNGWAMSMQGLKRQRDAGASAADLIVRPPDELLSENAERWQGRLEQLLLLLALLEPCAALRLGHLQTWWRHTHEEKISAPALRRTLRPVEEMLQPLGGGDAEVRLVHTAFAAFVRDRFFSRTDLVDGFDALCAWLATDLPDSEDLLAAPIIHWSTRLRVPPTQSDGLTKLFIALYDEPAESSRLDLFRRSRSRIAKEAPATWLDGVRQAANADVLSAMRALGLRLLDGDGIAQDTDAGERWLRKAADAGYCPAIVSLGGRLRFGDVIPMDINEGNSLLFKGAERGDADAMFYIGAQLVQGDGLSQDVNQGMSWLRKAANSSHPYAMFALGFELLSGRLIHQDTAEAASWLRLAAEANVPFAMILYAICLIDGLGCKREPSDGLNWLRKAANSTQTHPLLPPEFATCTLADALLHIQVEEENSAEGIQLLRKAAEAGNTFAMTELGSRLLDGRNAPLDPEDGLAWLRKAAEAGNNLAMTDIGGRFLDGRGVPQNHSEGVAWLHRAVEPR